MAKVPSRLLLPPLQLPISIALLPCGVARPPLVLSLRGRSFKDVEREACAVVIPLPVALRDSYVNEKWW